MRHGLEPEEARPPRKATHPCLYQTVRPMGIQRLATSGYSRNPKSSSRLRYPRLRLFYPKSRFHRPVKQPPPVNRRRCHSTPTSPSSTRLSRASPARSPRLRSFASLTAPMSSPSRLNSPTPSKPHSASASSTPATSRPRSCPSAESPSTPTASSSTRTHRKP